MIEKLLPMLTEEEAEVYRRGMQNRRQWQKMPQCLITGKQPDLRR